MSTGVPEIILQNLMRGLRKFNETKFGSVGMLAVKSFAKIKYESSGLTVEINWKMKTKWKI